MGHQCLFFFLFFLLLLFFYYYFYHFLLPRNFTPVFGLLTRLLCLSSSCSLSLQGLSTSLCDDILRHSIFSREHLSMYAAAVPAVGQREGKGNDDKAEQATIRTYPRQLFETVREAVASTHSEAFLSGLPRVYDLFLSCCTVSG